MRESRGDPRIHDRTSAAGRWLGVLSAALAVFLAFTPSELAAQAPQVERDELTVYARAHVAMNEARDEFHAEIAAEHEDQAKERAREAFEERIVAIFEEHAMTRERYEEITLLVSADETLRAALIGLLEELQDGADSSDP